MQETDYFPVIFPDSMVLSSLFCVIVFFFLICKLRCSLLKPCCSWWNLGFRLTFIIFRSVLCCCLHLSPAVQCICILLYTSVSPDLSSRCNSLVVLLLCGIHSSACLAMPSSHLHVQAKSTFIVISGSALAPVQPCYR